LSGTIVKRKTTPSFRFAGVRVLEDMVNVTASDSSYRYAYTCNPPFLSRFENRFPDHDRELHELHASRSQDRSITPLSLQNRSISSSTHDHESSDSINTRSPIDSHSHSDEMQHVPSRKMQANEEQGEVVRREKKRERNRQAAQKCRTRKLTRIAELQKRVNELQGKNRELNGLAECLKGEVFKLEKQLDNHRTQGCTLMSNGLLN
jgi:chromosome segregation ATPase